MQQNSRRKHPSRYPQGDFDIQKLLGNIVNEEEDRGEVRLSYDNLSKEKQQKLAKVFSDLSIKESDLDEDEKKVIHELHDLVSKHPDYHKMSPDEFFDLLKLKQEDKDALHEEIKAMTAQAERDLQDVNIVDIVPEAKDTLAQTLQGLGKAFEEDPSLRQDFDQWIQNVKAKVGDDFKGMESLSDAEFVSLAIPPERLQTVIQTSIPSLGFLSGKNADDVDPRDIFLLRPK